MGAAMPLPEDGEEPDVCQVGGGGYFFPIFGDSEHDWPRALRGILYLIGLSWFFLGVAIIAEVFMGSIERITAKKVRRWSSNKKKIVTMLVWNETVANLTLMALGSSAPEILLSVVELLLNEFYAGDLGPPTIVGSAAFNLLMILSVCVSAIPAGEKRAIKEVGVYFLTVVASIFAYIWLLIILVVSTPNIVTPVEGVVTFLYFPLLVFMAWLVDVRYFKCLGSKEGFDQELVIDYSTSKEDFAKLERSIQEKHGGKLSPEQLVKIIQTNHTKKNTRAHYRVAATRQMTGGKRVRVSMPEFKRLFTTHSFGMSSKKVVPIVENLTANREAEAAEANMPTVEFNVDSYAVLESWQSAKLTVVRRHCEDKPCKVQYCTRGGKATPGADYIHTEGFLEFEPGELEKVIEVTLVDDEEYEGDEDFFVDLSDPEGSSGSSVLIGGNKTVTVTIIDDDLPGTLAFPNDIKTVEQGLTDHEVTIEVIRTHGSTGTVGCTYETEDDTALAGKDYEHVTGTIEFKPGETVQSFKICIKARGSYESREMFRVNLTEPLGGAIFDRTSDGGKSTCILSVYIEPTEERKQFIDKMFAKCALNWDRAQIGHQNYADQFKAAIQVNGGDKDILPTMQDKVLHVVMLPWKLIFACVPPVDYCQGWVCFCSSLLMIGAVTALVGELAALLGCVIGLGNMITAITIVALGTSLPDTFASKTAAVEDEYADASVCNVTGSNSVNVFLGLGLPWMIGAFYWTGEPTSKWLSKYAGKDFLKGYKVAFVVEANSLVFSVTVFTMCAVCCIVVLSLRRRLLGGELGGPVEVKYATSAFLAFLWAIYIGMSCWYELK